MCFLILEIGLLVGGLWALISARVPSFLVGGSRYNVEGRPARLIGILLMLPLPAAISAGMVLGYLFGEKGIQYATWVEFGSVVGACLLAVILVRVVGRPVPYENDMEAVVARKAQGALMYALMTATGVAAIVVCPLAFFYAGQALRLIQEHGVGEQYRGRAVAARAIAGAITGLWVLGVSCVLAVVLAR